MDFRAGMAYGQNTKFYKAIFAIRDEPHLTQNIYTTRGMACAVNIPTTPKPSVAVVTWNGVLEANSGKPVTMHRFSRAHPRTYILHVSRPESSERFSFLSVEDSEKKEEVVVESLDMKALSPKQQMSHLKAYCICGTGNSEKLEHVELTYNRSTKEYNLSFPETTKIDSSNLPGSPIIVEENSNKYVVGVLGRSETGETFFPCFLTKDDISAAQQNYQEKSRDVPLAQQNQQKESTDDQSVQGNEQKESTDDQSVQGNEQKESTDDQSVQGNEQKESTGGKKECVEHVEERDLDEGFNCEPRIQERKLENAPDQEKDLNIMKKGVQEMSLDSLERKKIEDDVKPTGTEEVVGISKMSVEETSQKNTGIDAVDVGADPLSRSRLSTNVKDIPFPVLSRVCLKLDIKEDIQYKDFRMLGEKLGFEKDITRNLEQRKNPTYELLQMWSSANHQATVERLIEFLKEEDMKRVDVAKILEDWVQNKDCK